MCDVKMKNSQNQMVTTKQMRAAMLKNHANPNRDVIDLLHKKVPGEKEVREHIFCLLISNVLSRKVHKDVKANSYKKCYFCFDICELLSTKYICALRDEPRL